MVKKLGSFPFHFLALLSAKSKGVGKESPPRFRRLPATILISSPLLRPSFRSEEERRRRRRRSPLITITGAASEEEEGKGNIFLASLIFPEKRARKRSKPN